MLQRVEGSIEIEAPVETVYGYWETLENLPNFMANVAEVTSTGPDTTRWRVKGPFGGTLEWGARTTHKEPNSTIGWIANAGFLIDLVPASLRTQSTLRDQGLVSWANEPT